MPTQAQNQTLAHTIEVTLDKRHRDYCSYHRPLRYGWAEGTQGSDALLLQLGAGMQWPFSENAPFQR